jgi:hypothetical protein
MCLEKIFGMIQQACMTTICPLWPVIKGKVKL